MGYAIACSSKNRQAYGWQRNGGIAPYILCDEKDLIALPDELTYKDGASVSCGFGTVYEAIEKIGVSGDDAVLVVGLGPVGMAALMLCRAMGAEKLIGVEMNEYRIKMVQDMGLVDHIVRPSDNAVEEIRALTGGHGVERAIDCSASDAGRQTAIRATRDWGRVVLVGEGNSLTINPSPDMMHAQKTVYGSWVTSTWRMMELVEHLVAGVSIRETSSPMSSRLSAQTRLTHGWPAASAARLPLFSRKKNKQFGLIGLKRR